MGTALAFEIHIDFHFLSALFLKAGIFSCAERSQPEFMENMLVENNIHRYSKLFS